MLNRRSESGWVPKPLAGPEIVLGDREPVSNLILRQKSLLSLPSFLSFFLWGPDETASECGLGIKREWREEKGIGEAGREQISRDNALSVRVQ